MTHKERICQKTWFSMLLSFLITVSVAIIGCAVIGVWPFGNHTLLIVDSIHQYLPFFTELQRKLADGQSLFYSFSGGMGYNFWTTIAYYLASPWNLILSVIPTENVCDFMDGLIILKMGLCSACFTFYLNRRRAEARRLSVAFGVSYGLSSFVIGYYFNLMWLDSVAMLPLIMYGLEKLVKKSKWRTYCAALFYGIWCNYYIGFMLCLFSCLYVLLLMVTEREEKIGKVLCRFFLSSLLAGGMSAVLLLPAYAGLQQSQSVIGNSFPDHLEYYENIWSILKSHMIGIKPINISDTQKGLNVYCGLLTLPGVILFFCNREICNRVKVGHLLLAGLFVLSFCCNIPNYIWHGFHVQNGLPNRFAFLYIGLLLKMAFDGFSRSKKVSLEHFIIPINIVCAAYAFTGMTENLAMCISIGLLLLYAVVCRIEWKMNGKIGKIIPLFILAEISCSAVWGFHCNGGVDRDFYLKDQSAYQTMMEQYAEKGFYRSEVDRQHMRNISMFAGANSIVMFNSTMQQSVIDFCKAMGIEARMNKNGYYGVTPFMNDLLGIRYVASPSRKANQFCHMPAISGYGPLTLYENRDALSIGFMIKDTITKWHPDDYLEPLDAQNAFIQMATGIPYLYEYGHTLYLEDDVCYTIALEDGKQTFLCLDENVEEITVKTPEYDRTIKNFNSFLYQLNPYKEERKAEVMVGLKPGKDTAEAEIYTCSVQEQENITKMLARHQLEDVIVKGNRLSGTIRTDEAGILLLTIPYDKGWKIWANEKEVDPVCVGSTFLGIRLSPGEYRIQMEYTPLYFRMGAWISAIFLLVFTLSYKNVWKCLYKKSKKI